jgi:hypothetical protein
MEALKTKLNEKETECQQLKARHVQLFLILPAGDTIFSSCCCFVENHPQNSVLNDPLSP